LYTLINLFVTFSLIQYVLSKVHKNILLYERKAAIFARNGELWYTNIVEVQFGTWYNQPVPANLLHTD